MIDDIVDIFESTMPGLHIRKLMEYKDGYLILASNDDPFEDGMDPFYRVRNGKVEGFSLLLAPNQIDILNRFARIPNGKGDDHGRIVSLRR